MIDIVAGLNHITRISKILGTSYFLLQSAMLKYLLLTINRKDLPNNVYKTSCGCAKGLLAKRSRKQLPFFYSN